MANVKVGWVLPVVRESGKSLALGDIKHVRIEISANGGADYGEFGVFAPAILETTITDLEPGEWWLRGFVVDTKDRASQPVAGSVVIEDQTPPGPLVLNLSLV